MNFIHIIVFLIEFVKRLKKKYILLNQSMYFLFFSENYVTLVPILIKNILTIYSPHLSSFRTQTL